MPALLTWLMLHPDRDAPHRPPCKKSSAGGGRHGWSSARAMLLTGVDGAGLRLLQRAHHSQIAQDP